ncbi:MAG: SH3 domain-containing protein [Bacilli bacterium]
MNKGKVILNIDKINHFNSMMKNKCDFLYNMNINKISKKELTNYIINEKIPILPKYDNTLITDRILNACLLNRNIFNIKDCIIRKGLVINRTILKSLPTNTRFFNNLKEKDFNLIANTALIINTFVLIFHESLDKKWFYVRSYFYQGWVNKKDIAITDIKTDYSTFVIVTSPLIKINNKYIDMSAKFQLVKELENKYKVILYDFKNEKLLKKEVYILKSDSNLGYMLYTKENVIMQALKYKDINYGWGGMNNGVDCSSFIINIFNLFGFMFPRDTINQKKVVGNIINTSKMSNLEKINIINNLKNPALIYTDYHVLLHIKDNCVIHASSVLKKVQVDFLNNVNGNNLYKSISSINKIF